MQRTQLIFLLESALVGLGLLTFIVLKLRNPKTSHFKDDLWKEDPKVAKHLDEVIQSLSKEKAPLQLSGPPPEAFLQPKFNGAPHEVLGLKPNPSPDQVKAAHRYWIKRYHPDKVTHLGKEYVNQARHRAEQLNRARTDLLDKS